MYKRQQFTVNTAIVSINNEEIINGASFYKVVNGPSWDCLSRGFLGPILATILIRPGLQSKLSSLTVCNSKNGMGFGPSWALMRPCWETILESSWGSLGTPWGRLGPS